MNNTIIYENYFLMVYDLIHIHLFIMVAPIYIYMCVYSSLNSKTSNICKKELHMSCGCAFKLDSSEILHDGGVQKQQSSVVPRLAGLALWCPTGILSSTSKSPSRCSSSFCCGSERLKGRGVFAWRSCLQIRLWTRGSSRSAAFLCCSCDSATNAEGIHDITSTRRQKLSL